MGFLGIGFVRRPEGDEGTIIHEDHRSLEELADDVRFMLRVGEYAGGTCGWCV